jgi:acyl-CoA synthetase (AMP-forming)/AMP-acid ligase II
MNIVTWHKEETIADGWIHTGDIAKMDEEGYFYFVDRKKDMIIYVGHNVYPRDIEEVFYEYPKVMDAAAIGAQASYGIDMKYVLVAPIWAASRDHRLSWRSTRTPGADYPGGRRGHRGRHSRFYARADRGGICPIIANSVIKRIFKMVQSNLESLLEKTV